MFAPEDDTECCALKDFSDFPFRTFVDVPFFASLKLFCFTNFPNHDLVKSAIDLGLSSGISAFAYSLERR